MFLIVIINTFLSSHILGKFVFVSFKNHIFLHFIWKIGGAGKVNVFHEITFISNNVDEKKKKTLN